MDLKSKQILNNNNHITCLSGLSQSPLIGPTTSTTTINGNNNNISGLISSGTCDNVSERSTPNSQNSFNSPSSLNSFNSPNRITHHHNHSYQHQHHHHHQQQQQQTPQSPLILSCNSTTITPTSSNNNNNNNAQSSIFFPPLPARSSHHQLTSTLVTTATSTKIVDRSPRSADINMNAESERNRESSSTSSKNLVFNNNILQQNKQHNSNSNNNNNNNNNNNSNSNQPQHLHQRFSSTASQQSSNLNSPIIMPAKSFAGFFSEASNLTQQQFQQPSIRRSINLGSTLTSNNSSNGVAHDNNNWSHGEQQIDDSYHLYHEPIDPDDEQQTNQSSIANKSNQQSLETNNTTNKSPISTTTTNINTTTTTTTTPPVPVSLTNSRVSTPTNQQQTSRVVPNSNSTTKITSGKNDISADIYFCYVSMKSSERSNQRSRSYHGPKNSNLLGNINANNHQATLSSTSFAELPTTNTINIANTENPLTMRDHCINELIGTEMNYTHALNHILTYFAKPLEQYLRKDENHLIFGHMKYFYSIHTTFQAELVKYAPNVSVCFLNARDKFLRYGEYCATLLRAQGLLDDLVNRSDTFAAQLDRCHHEANEGKFKLADLLSLPMQRILKYHLLLAELIKNTRSTDEDYNGLKRAHDAMIDLGKYINEAKRDTELMQIIDDIEQSISGLNMPMNTKLTDYGRLHIDGIIRIKLPIHNEALQHKQLSDGKIKQKRYAFVFDKVLLMCKVGLKGYQYKEALVLSEYVLNTDPIVVQSETISAKHLIREKWTYNFNLIRTADQTTYSFFTKDLDTKNAWIEAIQKALDNIRPAVCRTNDTDHEFLMHTFERASSCDHCGKLFHGLHYQGYRCKTCFASVHKSCLGYIRPCGPTLPPKPNIITSHNNTLTPQTTLHRDNKEQISPSVRSNSSDDSHNFFNHFPCPLNELSIKDSNSNINLTATSTIQTSRNESVNNYVNFRLNDHLWFCGRMERDRAQALLQNMPDGTFLVRVSPKHNGSYVISLNHNYQIKHMRINVSKDNELYLSQNRYFKSVIELVSWYEKNSLVESFHMLDARLAIPYKANQPTL